MAPRVNRTLLKFLLLVVLFICIIYIHFIWRLLSMELKKTFYRYGRIFSRDEDDDANRFKEIYDELITFEKFSVTLQEPEEATILPAWVKKHKLKSNDKTLGKNNRLMLSCFILHFDHIKPDFRTQVRLDLIHIELKSSEIIPDYFLSRDLFVYFVGF